MRQLLTEGLLLGLTGGALGLLLAPMVTRTLVRTLFTDPNSEIPFSTQPDLRIFAFNFAVAFVVSVLFSLAPAWRFLRPDLVTSLKQQTGTATGSSLRVQRLSVAVQIGLSLVLLIGAGLFVRTLENLRAVNVGFVTDHLLSFGTNARLAGYQADQMQSVTERVLDGLAALPGVRSVAATDDPDLDNEDEDGNISVAGYNAGEDEDMQVEQPWISSGYFKAMEVPVLAGRDFTWRSIGQAKQPGHRERRLRDAIISAARRMRSATCWPPAALRTPSSTSKLSAWWAIPSTPECAIRCAALCIGRCCSRRNWVT